jgi:hypothetical protein
MEVQAISYQLVEILQTNRKKICHAVSEHLPAETKNKPTVGWL